MKSTLITIVLIATFSIVKAQQTDTTTRVYTVVDQYPTPSDNWSNIRSNKKYPESALRNKLEGEIFLTFIVEKDGSLTNIEVRQGVSPDLDAEAIRIINKSHKWTPGMQDGKPVRVRRSIVIYFELPSKHVAKLDALRKIDDSLHNLQGGQRIFNTTEKGPSFPGKFYQYIRENLKYPDIALKNGVYGTVILSLVVERDGSLSNIRLLKGLTPETDAEAIRLMEVCPNWIPAMQDGIPVRIFYSVNIPFELPGKN